MKLNAKIMDYNQKLFSTDYFGDYSEEFSNSLLETSEKLIKDYGWDNVFPCWFSYFKNKCKNIKQAKSFINWFVTYGGHTRKIKHPYEFLGYLFNYFGLDETKLDDRTNDVLDMIYVGILEKAGIIHQDNYFTKNPGNDRFLLDEINRIKEKHCN